MKNSNIIKIASFFCAIIFIQAFSAKEVKAAECSALTGTDIPTPNASGNRSCTATPTFLRLKFYEAGICKNDTFNSAKTSIDKTNCAILFENTNGQPGDITAADTDIQLSDNVSIDEGEYTHAYILIDSEWNFQLRHEFDSDRTAVVSNVPGSSATTSGASCYTNSGVVDDGNVECASSSANLFSSTNAQVIGSAPSHNYFASTMSLGSGPAVSTETIVLNSDETISTSDIVPGSVPPQLISGHSRKYYYVQQELLSSININPDTAGLNIQFLVTDSGQILFEDPTSACPGCIRQMSMTAPTFNWSSF
tara:strand:- start:430 stop:1353 length:924 start_codon:yes stop_codon:yes gene_type:complete